MNNVVNWAAGLELDTSKAEKKLQRFEAKLNKVLSKQAKLADPITGAATSRRPQVSTGRVTRTQPAFNFTDVAQLKTIQSIEAIVRRAAREFGETSAQFAKVNRQAAVLKERIGTVNSPVALQKLRNSIRLFREDTNVAINNTRTLNRELKKQQFVANATRDSFRNLARSYVSVFAGLEVGRNIVRTGVMFENLSSQMLLASGSSEQAAEDFEYLRKLSIRLGLDLSTTSESFAKFGVAARSSGLSTEQTQSIFTKLSEAIRATGLSSERAGLAMLGFRQMISGAVIQGQEMNQVVDQMPQFAAAAKVALQEMGYEVENYKKAIETGTVESVEFLTRVSDIMARQARETGALDKAMNSITAQSARLKTAWQDNVVSMFEAGTGSNIAEFIKRLTDLTASLRPLFTILGKLAGSLLSTLAAFTSGLGSLVNTIGSLITVMTKVASALGIIDQNMQSTANVFKYIGGIVDQIVGAVKRIVGYLLLPIGLIERVLRAYSNLDFSSFSAFTSSMKEVRKNLADQFAADTKRLQNAPVPATGTSAYWGVRAFTEVAARADGRRISGASGPSKVNSDNTFQAEINIPSGDPEVIRSTMDNWWQDTMKIGG